MRTERDCSDTMGEWIPAYSIGHRLLDDQHKRILSICKSIDELAALQGNEYADRYHALLNELFIYSDQHFKTEEGIFNRLGCPELAAHRQEHLRYTEKLLELNLAAMRGVMDEQSLREFAFGWWVSHILHTDMQCKPYLLNSEPAEAP